jgi:non-specific protein-tyrosine kinase
MPVNLITLTDPRAASAEAYRALRTNLMYSGGERPITTLMLTTAARAEDKSIAVANLAVTFAQAGYRTILVDADLRRPSQHTIWGVDNARGLTTMISDDTSLASPPLLPTEVPNLNLLTSGALPAVPADVLGSKRMSDILGVLKARAAYVLFDVPPVLVATDAAVLGVKVDGVVLVARAGLTRRDQVGRAREALTRVGARLLGAVLTNAPREMKGY